MKDDPILVVEAPKDDYWTTPSGPQKCHTLSNKAKNIHACLAHTPQLKKGMTTQDLIKMSSDGRSAILSGFQELEEHGFLHRMQTHGKNGSFGKTLFLISNNPLKLSPRQLRRKLSQTLESFKSALSENLTTPTQTALSENLTTPPIPPKVLPPSSIPIYDSNTSPLIHSKSPQRKRPLEGRERKSLLSSPTETDGSKPTGTRKFIRPTEQETVAFFKLHNFQSDPSAFWNNHEKGDWKYGHKNTKQIVNWKAAAREWERHHQHFQNERTTTTSATKNRSQVVSQADMPLGLPQHALEIAAALSSAYARITGLEPLNGQKNTVLGYAVPITNWFESLPKNEEDPRNIRLEDGRTTYRYHLKGPVGLAKKYAIWLEDQYAGWRDLRLSMIAPGRSEAWRRFEVYLLDDFDARQVRMAHCWPNEEE